MLVWYSFLKKPMDIWKRLFLFCGQQPYWALERPEQEGYGPQQQGGETCNDGESVLRSNISTLDNCSQTAEPAGERHLPHVNAVKKNSTSHA